MEKFVNIGEGSHFDAGCNQRKPLPELLSDSDATRRISGGY